MHHSKKFRIQKKRRNLVVQLSGLNSYNQQKCLWWYPRNWYLPYYIWALLFKRHNKDEGGFCW